MEMNELLDAMRSGIGGVPRLDEGQDIPMARRDMPPVLGRMISWFSIHDEFLYRVLTEWTDWWWLGPNPKCDTAAVGRHNGRIQFYLSPRRMKDVWTDPKRLAFVFAHELGHILRGHTHSTMGMALPNQHTANIAYDMLINEDILKQGTYAGLPVKFPIDEGWLLTSRKVDGFTSQGVDKFVGPNKKYDGDMNSIALYHWIMKNRIKKPKPQEEPQEKPPEGPPEEPRKNIPEVGDVISHKKTKQYGQVTAVKDGKVLQITPIDSKEAARQIARQSGNNVVMLKRSAMAPKKAPRRVVGSVGIA